MREDMAKVLNEPARGWKARSPTKSARLQTKRQLQLEDDDYGDASDSPVKRYEYSRRRSAERKFNDHILRRWLKSKVGQTWDDVYSELTKVLNGKGATYFMYKYVDACVEQRPIMIDGAPYMQTGHDSPLPLYSYGTYYRFYVEPESRLLRQAPNSNRPRREVVCVPGSHGRRWFKHEGKIYALVGGVWYAYTLREATSSERSFGDLLHPSTTHHSITMRTISILRSDSVACYLLFGNTHAKKLGLMSAMIPCGFSYVYCAVDSQKNYNYSFDESKINYLLLDSWNRKFRWAGETVATFIALIDEWAFPCSRRQLNKKEIKWARATINEKHTQTQPRR